MKQRFQLIMTALCTALTLCACSAPKTLEPSGSGSQASTMTSEVSMPASEKLAEKTYTITEDDSDQVSFTLIQPADSKTPELSIIGTTQRAWKAAAMYTCLADLSAGEDLPVELVIICKDVVLVNHGMSYDTNGTPIATQEWLAKCYSNEKVQNKVRDRSQQLAQTLTEDYREFMGENR